ncbi:hypothetical protein MRX96_031421 [Rhipicephalus microplus]
MEEAKMTASLQAFANLDKHKKKVENEKYRGPEVRERGQVADFVRVPPVTFSPPPLRTRSAQEPPCISGWGGLWKRTVPCGSLDWLLECDGPLDWDRRRSLDRDLARPLDEVPFRWPWERLLDRDLDLDRLLACCDESRLSTPVAAERLFELELRCAGWLTPSSALAGTVC